jgi:hypothetical protein
VKKSKPFELDSLGYRYDVKTRAKMAKLTEDNGLSRAKQLAESELGYNITDYPECLSTMSMVNICFNKIHRLLPDCQLSSKVACFNYCNLSRRDLDCKVIIMQIINFSYTCNFKLISYSCLVVQK